MRDNTPCRPTAAWEAGLAAAVVIFAVCLAAPTRSLGCVGARPLSMGGAFVAVADDVYTTYWNQAGLARLPSAEVGATFDTDRQDLNYDITAGVAAPLGGGRGGLGLLYTYNEDDWGWEARRDHFVQAGGALRVWPAPGRLAPVTVWAGLGGKYIERELEVSGLTDSAGCLDMDLSLLVDAGPAVSPTLRMFSFGLLIQNVLESSLNYSLFGREQYGVNVRPALAFRPDGWTVLALEVYDAAERTGTEPGLRLGLERWLGLGLGRPVLAVRLGGYHVNEEDLRAFTFGLGLRPTPRVELSYGLLYWTQSERTTHLLSAGWRF